MNEEHKRKLLAKQPGAINVLESGEPCPGYGCGADLLFYQLADDPPSIRWPKVTLIDQEAKYWLRGGFFCPVCGWGNAGSLKIEVKQESKE